MQKLRQVWDDFIGEINRQDLNVHAIALGRGEEAFFKAHARELDPSDLHRQFSVTKTYTAMALMCLVEDGKITLDDKIIDYYPDLADETDFFYLATYDS
jgi:CubicO group peptidase (beta-lactamase class C family)